jgi:hypothetical protein
MMTDQQAKKQTIAVLKSVRETVLDRVYDYLWMTLNDSAANYLSATGNLSSTKTASSMKCELRNLLSNSEMDPNPLIVRKSGKRRVKVSYKGLSLAEHIQRKGYRAIRHRNP